VRVEGVVAAGAVPAQLQLGSREHGWRDADRAVDRAVERYGAGAVRPAALVPRAADADLTGQFGTGIGLQRDRLRPRTDP
jgi:DNA polymerase-4